MPTGSGHCFHTFLTAIVHCSKGLAQIMPPGQCGTKMALRSTHGEDLKPGCSKAVPNSKKQILPSSVFLQWMPEQFFQNSALWEILREPMTGLLLSEHTRSGLESYTGGVLQRGFGVIWGAVIRGIGGLKGTS